MAKITFSENNLTIEAKEGSDLLDLYRKDNNLPMRFGCTRGGCGACSMVVLDGSENLTKKSKVECSTLTKKGMAKDNYRLACQCAVLGDVTIQFV